MFKKFMNSERIQRCSKFITAFNFKEEEQRLCKKALLFKKGGAGAQKLWFEAKNKLFRGR